MNVQEKFDTVRNLLDEIIDTCKMEKTVEAIDTVTAVDRLHKAANRKNLVERNGNEYKNNT